MKNVKMSVSSKSKSNQEPVSKVKVPKTSVGVAIYVPVKRELEKTIREVKRLNATQHNDIAVFIGKKPFYFTAQDFFKRLGL